LIHSTPVRVEITLIIKKEDKAIKPPIIPNLKLFSAPEIFLGSPSAFINLKPPIINMIRAVSPTNAKRALRIFKKIAGRQERVATSPCRQPPLIASFHALNILNITKE